MRKPWLALSSWMLMGSAVGVVCGVSSALFLFLLERVSAFREAHDFLVYLLPAAGFAIGLVYDRWGKPIEGGSSLVLDTIHADMPKLPLRMAPMVLAGTVLTHAFGGSAGREGTAVQMGASLADDLAHRWKVDREGRRRLLASGMAGGFGSVFGTPIAGAIFGIEVVTIGRMEYEALLPALIASVVGDAVTRALGIVHATYPKVEPVALTPSVVGKLVVLAVGIAAITVLFVEITHRGKRLFSKTFRWLPLRMLAGGLMLVALWKLVGTSAYLGLGVETILRSFSDPHLPRSAFAWKLVFTAVTLGSGFLGGEVTPLFFVGAAFGSVLSRIIGLPIDLGAGLGMAAVFGAAANTPLALSIMAVELLGTALLPHVVLVTVMAFLLTGHRGIYPAQRIHRQKHDGRLFRRAVSLRELSDAGTQPETAPPGHGGEPLS